MKYNIYHIVRLGGKVDINTFNSLMITKDINSLTDTASITIPYANFSLTSESLTLKSENANDLSILKGDSITIYIDFYTSQLEKDNIIDNLVDSDGDRKIFDGYIKGFNVINDLVEIQCEDSMYLFKQKKTNFSFPKDTKSTEVIDFLIDDYQLEETITTEVVDANLGKVRTGGYVTGAKVFQGLQDKYKYFTYFKLDENYKPKLYFGLKYSLKIEDVNPLQFAYPYDPTKYIIIQNNLNYQMFNKIDDLIVVGSAIDELTNLQTQIVTIDGIKVLTQVTKSKKKDAVPDTPAEAKNKRDIKDLIDNREFRVDLNFKFKRNIPDLEDLVKETWNNHPTSGFEGSFTTFGKPFVKIGDIVELNIDDGFGEIISENYYVDTVVIKIIPNSGFTSEITVGAKLPKK